MKIWGRAVALCDKVHTRHPEMVHADLLWAAKRLMRDVVAKDWETPANEAALIELAKRRPPRQESAPVLSKAERQAISIAESEDRYL